ncbi:maleylpyruvate isomerase N-terminal domain-containing protein [Actinoplanes sp. NPDC049265]|uniref:maleylpyruvate isomerase N-terminal domain-containing protein n=1 Tax=Actinoplanes sp. NPDC049265 TaxID=3363902 RepID=UPI00372437BC
MIEAYLSAARAVSGLLHSPAVDVMWEQPSALTGFRVSGLAGHLARAVFTVEGYLAAPPPVAPELVTAEIYLSVIGALTDDDNRRIVDRGEADAGSGPDDLRERYDAALGRLGMVLPTLPPSHPMPMFGGNVLPLRDCLVTRLVELLIHADDLAVSLNVATPAFADEATEPVLALLLGHAHRRHGTAALLRAFTRAERAAPIPAF